MTTVRFFRPARLTAAALAAVTMSGTLVALTVGSAAAQPDNPSSPHGKVCSPDQTFALKSRGYVDLGDQASSAWTWLHNRNASTASLQLSFATNSAVGWNVTASQSVAAGVIFAKVAASLSEGITYTHTDDYSKTASVSVPAHQYGEAGTANIYARGNGVETILYGNCDVAHVNVTLWEFPTKLPEGYETATTKSVPAKPPWPLAPR